MSNLPSFSILVTNMDGKHHLEECFTSLKELDYPKDLIEICMFDNASRDDSVEYTQKEFPFVKITTSSENIGAVGAYNSAARNAQNDILVFLNNDTKADSQWLKNVAEGFKNKDVAAVATKTLNYYKPDTYDSGGGRISFIGKGYDYNHGRKDTGETEPRFTSYGCAAALAIDAKIFHEIGGFNDSYFIYEDEVDLCWKAWLLGKKVLYMPWAVVYHKFGGTMGKGLSPTRVFHGTKNMFCTMFENFELKNLIPAFIVAVFFTISEIFILVIKGQFKKIPAIFKAYFWNVKNIKRTLERRRSIQSKRVITDAQLKKMGVIDSFTTSMKEYLFLRKKHSTKKDG